MNCEQAKRYILLEESGELSAHRCALLKEHIAGCPVCSEYRTQSLGLIQGAREALPEGTPSDYTLRRIMIAADQRSTTASGRSRRPALLRPVWQVATYAAMFLLLLGGLNLYFDPGALDTNVEGSGVEEVSTIIVDMMTDDTTATDDAESSETITRSREKLAIQLLRLEGLYMDTEQFDADAEFILSDDPLTLRSTGLSPTSA